MFSSRLPRSLAENRISAAVAAARARAPLLDLTETNPTAVGLDYPGRAILAALADPRALAYEPTPHGLLDARRAVAAYYARHGRAIDPDRVTLTASTSEAYAYLWKLLCDPGDDVLVPTPSYPLFEHLAALEGVRALGYPLRHHRGWFVDVEEVRRALTERTRAIVVVNPNNPTGHFLKRDEADKLIALAAERGLALVSDEVFLDYGFAPDPARAGTLAGETGALTFCTSGLSKPCGLPQLKLGWIVSSGPEAPRREAEDRLALIADTYLSVNAPVQHALPSLLPLVDDVGAQIAARTRQNRALVAAALAGSGATLYDCEGGWSQLVRVPSDRSEEAWVLELLGSGVLVHPGFFFDLAPTTLVLSLLPPGEVMRPALERLGRALV